MLQRCWQAVCRQIWLAVVPISARASVILPLKCWRVVRGSAHLICTKGLDKPQHYDFIVSNPPFHQGRADQPEIGCAFIVAAAAALRPAGCLWLVANRHLPYEQVLRENFRKVRTVAEEQGFKVIEAIKGK